MTVSGGLARIGHRAGLREWVRCWNERIVRRDTAQVAHVEFNPWSILIGFISNKDGQPVTFPGDEQESLHQTHITLYRVF